MKNKFFRSKLFSVGMILFLMLFISACSNKPGTIGEFIYAAGWYTDASNNMIACYWKNGVKTDLTVVVPIGTTETRATGIFVSGSDVYVAGYYKYSGVNYACYWKNGVKTDLTVSPTPDGATATSIYVSDSVVYVTGSYTNSTGSVACYWADDTINPVTETDLSVSTALAGVTATSIYVSGSVVYVAGSYTNSTGSVACYWTDDTINPVTETDLSVLTAPAGVTATSIYVSGSYVYVADTYINGGVNYAAMWTSDTVNLPVPQTYLTELTAPAGVTATSIYMIASDVYVGGYYTGTGSVACYWKNGVRADLPAVTNKDAEVESIFVATL